MLAMRASRLFFRTLREDPADAEIASHRLMVRAGLIRKVTSGIYAYLPLGQRVVRKVADIVREEMDRAGAQEVGLPIVQPAEIWRQTGRWFEYGPEMWRLTDRHGREYALGPTHEEVVTTLVAGEVTSFRQLPVNLYQIQNKFRDEVRPRFGVMRARDFVMKDAYSFDVDEAGMAASYAAMRRAYTRVFHRVGLDFRPVESDSGAIGGKVSEEFMALADSGEASLVVCEACGYAANVERAEGVPTPQEDAGPEPEKPLEKIRTPGVRTIEELVRGHGVPIRHTAKILFYHASYLGEGGPGRRELVAALVRGDRQLNEVKLKNLLGALSVELAPEDEVRRRTGAPFGSAGPVGLAGVDRLVADHEVALGRNFAVGANEEDRHYLNANAGRDFRPTETADLRAVAAGDPCPRCRSPLAGRRGIEVGQIFQLGTRYSTQLGAYFTAEDGTRRPAWMGCYGIGVTRTAAAAIEQRHDAYGIVWPISIAPFEVAVVPVHVDDEAQRHAAEEIYRTLLAAGVEALVDDRPERPGVKFADADLVGFPVRVTVGERALAEGSVDVTDRATRETVRVPLPQAAERVVERVRQARRELALRADRAEAALEAQAAG